MVDIIGTLLKLFSGEETGLADSKREALDILKNWPRTGTSPDKPPLFVEATDESAWSKQGFPIAVVKAFLGTADICDSVVMTRVPGKATTSLINEGYDLRGYFIKAKSYDRGPMAGFLWRPD